MARVAIVLTDGFLEEELRLVKLRLDGAGLEVSTVGQHAGEVVTGKGEGSRERVELSFGAFDPEDLCGALVPEGSWSDEQLGDPDARHFLRVLHMTGRPIAAISGGIRLLAGVGICRGCKMTSPSFLRAELEKAGARWFDLPVVSSGHIISGRAPEDTDRVMRLFLPAVEYFLRQMPPTEYLRETHHPH
jgi:protease I